jgi:hypothetical protein
MARIQTYEASIAGSTEQHSDFRSDAATYQGLAQLGQDVASGTEKLANTMQSTQAKKDITQGVSNATDAQLKADQDIKTMETSFNPNTTNPTDIPAIKNLKDSFAATNATIQDPSVLEKLTMHQSTIIQNTAKNVYARNAVLQTQENHQAIVNTQTGLTASAYTNPDSMDSLLKQADTVVDTLKEQHGLADGVSDKFRTDMKSAIQYRAAMGRIDQDPEVAQKELDANKYDMLAGNQIQTIQSKIDRQRAINDKQQEHNDKAATTAQDHAQIQAFHDSQSKVDNGQMSYKDIQQAANTGQITDQHADILKRRMDSLVAGAYQGSDAMAHDADRRLRLPPSDPEAITDFGSLVAEYNGGKNQGLDQAHLKRFSSMYLAPPGSDNGVKSQFGTLSDTAAKTLINPTAVPWGDREGLKRWGQAINFMHDDYQKKMGSGNFTSDQLLNPTSKDYIGNSIQNFKRSPQEIQAHAQDAIYNPNKSLNADKTYAQPVGANPKFTPMPTGQNSKPQTASDAGSGFSAAQMEVLKSLGPKKKAAN